jgi:hypothetical protein
MSSGTGYLLAVGHPCFPWPDPGATGAGGMGGGATGAGGGGGGGSMALPCPAPDKAPASWELNTQDIHDKGIMVENPYPNYPTDGMCCYWLSVFCI